jgi:putative hydrolase of the HAD superfamily
VKQNWVILDGDNTLWLVEQLYDEARVQLCDLLEGLGVDRCAADRFQRDRDHELHTLMGYSRQRFPRSFHDTLSHFVQNADGEVRRKAVALAEAVFDGIAPLPPDVDAVLEQLSASRRLALFTAGEAAVQASRLQAFGRTHHFEAVKVVDRKDRDAFAALVSELGIESSKAWMVGDSLRSDIHPAIEVGLRAIHIEAANWHPVETGTRSLPSGAFAAKSLTEAASIIERESKE